PLPDVPPYTALQYFQGTGSSGQGVDLAVLEDGSLVLNRQRLPAVGELPAVNRPRPLHLKLDNGVVTGEVIEGAWALPTSANATEANRVVSASDGRVIFTPTTGTGLGTSIRFGRFDDSTVQIDETATVLDPSVDKQVWPAFAPEQDRTW